MDLTRKEIIEGLTKLGIKKRAKLFILPMLDFYGTYLSEYDNNLIDICINGNKIILVFENNNTDGFKTLIYKLNCNNLYIDSFYGDDGKEVIVNFNVPSEYKDDYNRFKNGKYSEFSDKLKDKLKKLYNSYESYPEYQKFSMFDFIHPSEKKRGERAEEFGVETHQIKEIISAPELEWEVFHNIDVLRDKLEKLKDRHE